MGERTMKQYPNGTRLRVGKEVVEVYGFRDGYYVCHPIGGERTLFDKWFSPTSLAENGEVI